MRILVAVVAGALCLFVAVGLAWIASRDVPETDETDDV